LPVQHSALQKPHSIEKDAPDTLLLGILAFGFVLRLVFVLFSLLEHPLAVQVDTYRYMAIANAVGFASWFDLNDPAGYPLLLWLTGSTLESYNWILILQLILSTATIYLAWKLGRPYLTKRANHVLAALIAINPVSVFFTSQLMTETTFTFFFLLSIIILLRKYNDVRAIPLLTLSGLLLSFATLIRPGSIVTIGVLTAILLIQVFRNRVPWKNALSFIVASWMLVAVYAVGLKVRFNYLGISMKGNTMLSIYYTTPIMHSLGIPDRTIDSTMAALPVPEQYLDPTRADFMDGKSWAAKHDAVFYHYALHHPVHVAKVHLLGVAQMMVWPSAGLFQFHRHFGLRKQGDPNMHEREFHHVFYQLAQLNFGAVMDLLNQQIAHSSKLLLVVWGIGALLPIFTLLFAIAGISIFIRQYRASHDPHFRTQLIYLGAILFSYIFIIPQVAASARFRLPIEPLLALAACAALDWIIFRKRSDSLAQRT
jgi:hypothetical protein